MPRAAAKKKAVASPTLAGAVESRHRTARRGGIVTALEHDKLFKPYFNGESWDNWKIVLKAQEGMALGCDERAFFASVSGNRDAPTLPVREAWWIVGRRGGKDAIASAVAAFTAASFKDQHLLRPGERALVLCLACDRKQARIILNYIKSYFLEIPTLAAMVQGEMTAEGFALNNFVDIEVATNSFRSVRGRALLLVLMDECAFWRDENSARPDEEFYRAVEPGLGTLESAGSRIIGFSSPYRKSGLLYRKYTEHFGKSDEDSVLVIQAPTRTLNPSFSQAIIDRALRKDPAAADAEYGGNFRDDVGGYLGVEIIQAAVDTGVVVRPPHRLHTYNAFADPSGGRGDSFTCAVAHDDGGMAVLDCVIEVAPPFSPMDAISQIAATLREYGLTEVTGDRYAADFNVEMFNACGIRYRNSDRDRSAIYSDCLPLFTSGRARLLDNRKLITQFASLERKTTSMGRDRVDHPPGGHDDICNAAGGALVGASVADRRPRLLFG